MADQQLTLYNSKASGWGNRVSWALEELGAKYDVVHIDFANKPSYYFTKVNPAGLVPVLQIGPSLDDSTKIPESAVIAEYIAEVFPKAKLLTSDPLKNAHGRYFAERTLQIFWAHIVGVGVRKDAAAAPKLVEGLIELERHFNRFPGKYLLGDEITLGDVLAGPFFARGFAFAEGGLLSAGDAGKTMLQDTRWASIRAYNEEIAERWAFQRTFDKPYIVEYWIKKLGLTGIVPLVK